MGGKVTEGKEGDGIVETSMKHAHTLMNLRGRTMTSGAAKSKIRLAK